MDDNEILKTTVKRKYRKKKKKKKVLRDPSIPVKPRKNAKRVYVKPGQSAAKKNINIGKDRARQEFIDGFLNRTTLMSAIIGYEPIQKLLRHCGLNMFELKMCLIVNSFNWIEKTNFAYYGIGRLAYDKYSKILEDKGFFQMITKKPIAYAPTQKCRDFFAKMNEDYEEQMNKLELGVNRKSRIFKDYNRKPLEIDQRTSISKLFKPKE